MATFADWVEGARLRTLPAAIAPVLAGTAVAAHYGRANWLVAAGCLGLALAIQIGVNYANDFSDGIRGTDEHRVGPMRLVGSGAASPEAVKRAAFAFFGLACVLGLAVVAATNTWPMVAVGAVSIVAAWFYTGGKNPYGYAGLGEVSVFIFFGLVAVAGTVYVQMRDVPLAGWVGAVAMGLVSSAILVANNLRDIWTDVDSGKRTLATRLGDRWTRVTFVAMMAGALVLAVVFPALTTPLALFGVAFVWPGVIAGLAIIRGVTGPGLIPALKFTGIAEVVLAAGWLIGCAL